MLLSFLSDTFSNVVWMILTSAFGVQLHLAEYAPTATRDVVFRPTSASVENWRQEAATHLKMSPKSLLLLALGSNAERLPRCIKLNNYWCIKGRAWDGQLGSDEEGHAAFASASAGTRAAAILLRRYYVDLHRHSALAIVSHWAPDRCPSTTLFRSAPVRTAPAASARESRAPQVLDVARMTPQQRMATFDRIIAARRKVALARYRQWLTFVKAANRGATLQKAPARPSQMRQATTAIAPAFMPTPLFCASEGRRIAAYARRAQQGIAPLSADDLELVTFDGRPTLRAARMMLNMAAVEIGPLTVNDDVVTSALAELDPSSRPAGIESEVAGSNMQRWVRDWVRAWNASVEACQLDSCSGDSTSARAR